MNLTIKFESAGRNFANKLRILQNSVVDGATYAKDRCAFRCCSCTARLFLIGFYALSLSSRKVKKLQTFDSQSRRCLLSG